MLNHLPYKYFHLLSNLYFFQLEFQVADPIAESNGCLIKMEEKSAPRTGRSHGQDQRSNP